VSRLSTLLVLALLAAAGALAGCATDHLSADECRAADWRAKGVEDGRAGWPAAHFARYVEDCAGAAAPDEAAWSAGREEGLVEFCTPAAAYAAGREGRAYAGVCPDPVDPELLKANQHGLTWHELHRRVHELERLERSYRFNCPPGVGVAGRFGQCGYGSGVSFGSGWDPDVRDELRRLRQEIIRYASWPPPGGEVIGVF